MIAALPLCLGLLEFAHALNVREASMATASLPLIHFSDTNQSVEAEATAQMASWMGSDAAKTQLLETVCNQEPPVCSYHRTSAKTQPRRSCSRRSHDAVIVVLVPPTPMTWRGGSTMITLESMRRIQDNNRAEVRLFHDEADKLSQADIQTMLAAVSPRKACAVKIRFAQFPSGFVGHQLHPKGLPDALYKLWGWNYLHMIRFNFVDLMDPNIGMLAGFKYWMRMDSDCEWAGPIPDQFQRFDIDVNLGYLHNVANADHGTIIEGLNEFTKQFARSHGVDLDRVPAVSGSSIVRGYYNNLELGRIAMFQSPLALEYTREVVANQGIYKHRWGDALLRRIVVEVTGMKTEQVQHSVLVNYRHGWGGTVVWPRET